MFLSSGSFTRVVLHGMHTSAICPLSRVCVGRKSKFLPISEILALELITYFECFPGGHILSLSFVHHGLPFGTVFASFFFTN